MPRVCRYTVLISAIAFKKGAALFPLLLLFTLVIIVFSVVFTTLFEKIPALLSYPSPPLTTSVRTTALVNDWFIGQWQWLMGFAMWTTALSLYGSAYLDVYDHASAWWLLCAAIFIGYVLNPAVVGCFLMADAFAMLQVHAVRHRVLPKRPKARFQLLRVPVACDRQRAHRADAPQRRGLASRCWHLLYSQDVIPISFCGCTQSKACESRRPSSIWSKCESLEAEGSNRQFVEMICDCVVGHGDHHVFVPLNWQ